MHRRLCLCQIDSVTQAGTVDPREAGAEEIAPPEDKPYGERTAGVKDGFGNTWWIATYQAP
jgi:uncharacterized glyoxalase superfamily protein PhnB